MIKFPMMLSELAALCDGLVVGQGTAMITGICSASHCLPDNIAFVGSESAFKKLSMGAGTSFIVKPSWGQSVESGIVHDNPQEAFRKILVAIQSDDPLIPNVIGSETVSASAVIGDNVSIGVNSVIGHRVVLGEGCKIGANVVIEADTIIGSNTQLDHHVTIHHHTVIGSDCVISSGAVIGGQGFGFSNEAGNWHAIPQIGKVIIGDSVHIGSNTCIDRGAISDTVIGNNVIIDNLVHIAHNVKVNSGSAMAAGVGIAGSTVVGKNCLLAGQVGVVGHIKIADGVQVNGGARVLKSISKPGVYAGSFHALPAKTWNKSIVYFKKIEMLFKREK